MLLSLCVKGTHAGTIVDFVRDPMLFICDPAGEDGREGLMWKAFSLLHRREVHRRETGDETAVSAQWKDLLQLCDHPTLTCPSSGDNVLVVETSASNAWWFNTVVTSFVRGYACLHLSRWNEASKHLTSVLRSAQGLIVAGVAGDALLAYATLSMMATKDEIIASIIGSMAAACECEFDGNIPIKPSDVLSRIDKVANAANYGN